MGLYPDDEDELIPRVPKPSANDATAPATLRGLAPPGSTADLESRGGARAMPKAEPSPLQQQTTQDQALLQHYKDTGSGISQVKNPVGRGLLRGLETVGQVLLPGATPFIPGTEAHHNLLMRQQTGRIGEDLGEQQKQSTIEHTGAETEQSEAAAEKDRAEAHARLNPQPKEGLTPEETTIHDLMTGENGGPRLNPDTGKPFTYLEAFTKVSQAKQDTKPDKAGSPEQQFIDAEVKAGKTIQQAVADYAKSTQRGEPGSFMPLYDEKGHVSGAWDPKSGRVVKTPTNLPGNTSQGAGIEGKAQEAATKEQAPYKAMVDAASEAHQLADMANKGNAPADVDLALSFFKMMKGTGGAGIRFTQAEQNMIVNARSAGQGLLAIAQKVIDGGQPLTPEQRQNILAVMDMHAKAAQEHMAGGATQQGPAIGTVEGGYKFKGGNPADQKNWEKVQ